jgi:hypothetical protein
MTASDQLTIRWLSSQPESYGVFLNGLDVGRITEPTGKQAPIRGSGQSVFMACRAALISGTAPSRAIAERNWKAVWPEADRRGLEAWLAVSRAEQAVIVSAQRSKQRAGGSKR